MAIKKRLDDLKQSMYWYKKKKRKKLPYKSSMMQTKWTYTYLKCPGEFFLFYAFSQHLFLIINERQ